MANQHFVTGYPGFIGKHLVARLLERDRRGSVSVLVQPRFVREARREVQSLPEKAAARVEILVGDVADMHLGLSGEEYRRLTAEVTHVFHLAAISYLGVDRRSLERVNVDGTRNMLELAHDARRLVRFCHVSTVHVSGDRQGVIDEEELEEGQGFHNAYEETKFRAEVLVRKAMAELPITVFRPSTVVGDSRTGAIDRFDGPYYTAFELVTSPLRVPLPLPGDGSFPLNVVPSDFVVEAMIELAFREEAKGKTFHLVDPNPMSARKVYEYVARRAGKRTPRARLPARASVAILRLPFLEKLARPQRAAIEHLNELVIYNCRNTLEQLDGTGIRCPPLPSYLDKLLDFLEEQQRRRREARNRMEAAEDPLAPVAAEAPAEEPEEEPEANSGQKRTQRRRGTGAKSRSGAAVAAPSDVTERAGTEPETAVGAAGSATGSDAGRASAAAPARGDATAEDGAPASGTAAGAGRPRRPTARTRSS